jgi:hypothetical protein
VDYPDFVHYCDWFLDTEAEARVDFPSELVHQSGLILIASDKPLLLASTIHFGPRVRDFISAHTGDNQNVQIHRKITALLQSGTRVSLWLASGEDKRLARREFLKLLSPEWNG